MPLPGIGGAALVKGKGPKIIRLALHGHANRPFYHIVLTNMYQAPNAHPVEQLGTYDPMPNTDNQKLLSLNVERARYWMGEGAYFSPGLSELLGLAGFLPIQPRSHLIAWRSRHKEALAEAEAKAKGSEDPLVPSQPSSSSS